MKERSDGLIEAIEKAGGPVALARELTKICPKPISHAAISQWKQVPAERVLAVSQISGVPRSRIRPDLYPPAKRA